MMLAQQKLLRCCLRIAIDDRALLWPGVAWRRSVARRMLAQQKLLRCCLRIAVGARVFLCLGFPCGSCSVGLGVSACATRRMAPK